MRSPAPHGVFALGLPTALYGRPPGLPAGTVPLGVLVPGEGALAGVLMGLLAGAVGWRLVESVG